MNLKEYQEAALRTESIIEKLELNKDFVTLLFKLFVLNAEILDAIKKEIYYKNPKKSNEKLFSYLVLMEQIIAEAKSKFMERGIHSSNITLNPRVFHGIVGIATEAGEVVNVLVKNLEDGEKIDRTNVQEEATGDISWYNAILNDVLALNWEEGLERNIAKLKKRYPDKFSENDANNRNLEEERKALEGK